jgi:hypothetical protein
VLTQAGRDFLPVLFAIGAWGRKHRGGGKVTRFFDAETGTEIDAVTIDRVDRRSGRNTSHSYRRTGVSRPMAD